MIEISSRGVAVCVKGKNQILNCPFPEGSIADMEIINPNAISAAINQFISSLKVSNAQTILVFADNLCFETNLSGLPPAEQSIREARFIESVPFESVVAKRFVTGNTVTVAVINRVFFEFFRSVFSSNGCDVIAAVPAIAVKALGYGNQLDGKSCSLLTKKINQVQEQSFFENENDQFGGRERHFVHEHRNVFALLSFGAVAMALVTSLMTLRRPTSYTTKANTTPLVSVSSSPIPSPTTTEVALEALNLRISNGSGSEVIVSKLMADLAQLGLENFDVDTASVSAQTTQVGFSKNVSGPLRQNVLDVMNKMFDQVTIRELTDGNLDIYVVTGKNLAIDNE